MKNEDFIDDVLTKIGRNVILYQQLEQLLKLIIANGNVAGFVSQVQALIKERISKVNKQTMGTLVGQYVESSNPKNEVHSSEPEELDEAYVSFSFKVECNEDYYQNQKDTLAQLVSDRNELIHHFLPRFNTSSAKCCEALGKELDEQAERVRGEIKNVRSQVNTLYNGRKELLAYLSSEKGQNELELSFIRQSRLVLMLVDIAIQMKREDGWALTSTAGSIIKQHAPDELENMKDRLGYGSMVKLIKATEMFDVHEEATLKGGTRILYRLKSGLQIS